MTGTPMTADADTGADERVPITRSGFERLLADLDGLRTIQRPELLARIRRATLYVDPSVSDGVANIARYDLDVLDRRIAALDAELKRVEVVDPPKDPTIVQVGMQVTVRRAHGSEEALTVVGPLEPVPAHGYVSSDFPVGKALLGKRDGDTVTAGKGEESVRLTVVRIEKETTEVNPPEITLPEVVHPVAGNA